MRRLLIRSFLLGSLMMLVYMAWTGGITALPLVLRVLMVFVCGFWAGYQKLDDVDIAELLADPRTGDSEHETAATDLSECASSPSRSGRWPGCHRP